MRKTNVAFAVVFLSLVASVALAQGTYTLIAYPGGYSTYAHGIDAAGDVVGSYRDISNRGHGFLLSGGTYTTIDRPGAADTYLMGISDYGLIVGFDDSAGFVYDIQTKAFITISYPGAFLTEPYAINRAGTIVGLLVKDSQDNLGFEFAGFRYRQIAGPLGGHNTQVFGVSNSGVAVGYDVSANNFTNFSFKRGQYRKIVIPKAHNAVVYGINPAGNALIGTYSPSRGISAGFVYQDNTLTTLQFPGGTNTYPLGISGSGQVVGVFDGFEQSFMWTPPADVVK